MKERRKHKRVIIDHIRSRLSPSLRMKIRKMADSAGVDPICWCVMMLKMQMRK